jgi:hypothetical protein
VEEMHKVEIISSPPDESSSGDVPKILSRHELDKALEAELAELEKPFIPSIPPSSPSSPSSPSTPSTIKNSINTIKEKNEEGVDTDRQEIVPQKEEKRDEKEGIEPMETISPKKKTFPPKTFNLRSPTIPATVKEALKAN